MCIRDRHEYLLGNIADVLNIEYNEVVEHVIEGTQVCCFVLFCFLDRRQNNLTD